MSHPKQVAASIIDTPATLLTTVTSKRALTTFIWACNDGPGPHVEARTLAGQRMKTMDGVMQEFAAALQFPYYFGHNYPALSECLTDLEWLSADAYLLVIWDFPEMLQGFDRDLKVLLRILRDAAEEWSKPVQRGEYWDRGSIPFRVLLHAEPGGEMVMSERLETVGVTASPWQLPDWVTERIAQAERGA